MMMMKGRGFERMRSWPSPGNIRGLSGDIEENHEESWSWNTTGRYSKQPPAEYKSTTLLLDQIFRFQNPYVCDFPLRNVWEKSCETISTDLCTIPPHFFWHLFWLLFELHVIFLHVARMVFKRNWYKCKYENFNGRHQFGHLHLSEKVIIKWALKQ
jgi:hypothetical protein